MIKKRSAGHAKTSTIEVSHESRISRLGNPCRLQAIALPLWAKALWKLLSVVDFRKSG
jgi:hypothetical protein